jgi:peptidoglycan/xylan/chitin deacetylase (PgdA/CDA1 family)
MAWIALALVLLLSHPQDSLPISKVVIDGRSHEIIWTVDDHPCRQTPAILKLLRQYKLKAVFFVVTSTLYWYYKAPSYPPNRTAYERLKAIYAQGHEVGNHSYSHGLLCKKPLRHIRLYEIGRSQRLIGKTIGRSPTWWRPPHGQTCKKLEKVVKSFGLRTLWWDVSDWQNSYQSMIRQLKHRSRRHKRSIVLIHNNITRFKYLLKALYQKP